MAFPIILSAPSGAGKTTIARSLLRMRNDVAYSISATTRERRGQERDGVDYFFLTAEEFRRRRAAGEFAESAEVHGNWYGTLRTEVAKAIDRGNHVILAIDVQGARDFRKAFPEAVLIFLLPPSLKALLDRLRRRNADSPEAIGRRLQTALKEIEAVSDYHYVVVNDKLDVATAEVSAIIDAEMARELRVPGVSEKTAALVEELRRDIKATV